MRTASVFVLSVVLIAALLFLTACGGGSASTTSSSVSSFPTKTATIPANPPSTNIGVSAGKAIALMFLTEPAGGKAGQPLTTQPVVAIVDGFGTTVKNYIGSVNLLVSDGSGEISGTASMIFVEGIAKFNDITLSKAGSYTLKAVTREIQAAESSPFTVEP